MKKLAIGLVILGLVPGFLFTAFAALVVWTVVDGESETYARFLGLPEEVVEIPAPDDVLYRPDGSEVRLSELRGRPVVLHLWGTWCPPCVDEMPDLLARAAEENEELIAVAVGDDWESLEAMFPQGIPRSVVLPDNQEIGRELGVYDYPGTMLVDRDGVIRKRWGKARGWSEGEWKRFVDLGAIGVQP